jgi:hypothetical protein
MATWAVKTSLLLALSQFRGKDHGWIPVSTLQWLREHHDSRLPPPGSRVWMSGLSTSDIPASVQAATLYDADREPTAQCVTFSVGCVLFQVFATEQKDADLSPDNEAWLAPTGPYQAALVQITPSSTPHRWPPRPCSALGTGKRWLDDSAEGSLPGPEHSRVRLMRNGGGAALAGPRCAARSEPAQTVEDALQGLRVWRSSPPARHRPRHLVRDAPG